ncbi:hypothetical protein [Thermomonas flagellata]|uniref:hypothetical protein n=1 Tax=Thermomonas flagellata TaxID=2888524 RepID=UPI001F04E827|nr:hypothetical protein [Thermomonas flagellata]
MKLAPMAHAVRNALAVSAMAVALGLGSGAVAAPRQAPADTLLIAAHTRASAQLPLADPSIVQPLLVPAAPLATLTTTNPGSGTCLVNPGTYISCYGPDDISIDNTGTYYYYSPIVPTFGIGAYSYGGDVSIVNRAGANLAGVSTSNAFGIYAYATVGNTDVSNAATIFAYSTGTGLADGIFATGVDVTVVNTGDIYAVSASGPWASGIEAAGSGQVTVDNSGLIGAAAYASGAQANGIFASGGTGVTVDNTGTILAYAPAGTATGINANGGAGNASVINSGTIYAQGYYATGINAQATGNVTVNNTGVIAAGGLYTSVLGTAIEASSNGAGAAVGVTNSGDLLAEGYFGATGIAATASGSGGTVTVVNTGSVQASQYYKYGYGAYGIVTSADGNSMIANSGDITVTSGGAANGLTALSWAGTASVTNSGHVSVDSTASLYFAATGITAFSANGSAQVSNSGSVDARAKYWATGINATAQGDVAVDNSGSVYANGQKYAFGVYAVSNAGNVSVHNAAGGDIGFYSYLGRGWGVFGFASLGDVELVNDGAIAGYAFGQSAGMFARAVQGDATVVNTGSIAVSSGGNVAVGAFARADSGTASISNSGDIVASDFPGGYYTGYSAYGMFARGAYAQVSNSGTIVADGYYYATGMMAMSLYGTVVNNTGGSITATALGGATGIYAYSRNGNTQVVNASDITARGQYFGAVGIDASSANANVAINNLAAATLYAYSTASAIGIRANAPNGKVAVVNAGDITVVGAGSSVASATGIDAAASGDVTVANSGDIYAGSYYYSRGIHAVSTGGNVSVGNAAGANVYAYSIYGAVAVDAAATGAGTVTVSNAGGVQAYGKSFGGIGIRAGSTTGAIVVSNAAGASVQAKTDAGGAAVGVQAVTTSGNATINNAGLIHATAPAGTFAAAVMFSNSSGIGTNTLNNAAGGLIYASGSDGSAWAVVGSNAVEVINNQGTIRGAIALGGGNDVFNNQAGGLWDVAGSLYASFGDGDDVLNNAATAKVLLNGGKIDFGNGNDALNNAGQVLVSSTITFGAGNDTLANASGGLLTIGPGSLVDMGAGNDTVTNAGQIGIAATGTLALGDGNDTLTNASGGVISLAGTINAGNGDDTVTNAGQIGIAATGQLALGDGNDTLSNASGGLISLAGTIDTGNGNDSLTNAGQFTIASTGVLSFGDGNDSLSNASSGLIDLFGQITGGNGDDTLSNAGLFRMNNGWVLLGAGNNAFANTGTLRVIGNGNQINLGTGTLTNTGLVDFLNGATTDKLTITGNLAGTGSLRIDANLGTLAADQLVVNGSVAANAVQTVNVQFTGVPTTAVTTIPFATITGTSVAGNFVAGSMLGYNPNTSWLLLGLTVSSAMNTPNDVFSINLNVNGLSDPGTLAASIASGAAGIVNTAIGTFRQRLGTQPFGEPGKVISPYVRVFMGEGDVHPAHVAANFGQGGHFNYDQSTWGREVGVNANLFGNFHAGLALGSANSRQRLIDGGVGVNRFDGMTWGAYATWYQPQGWYVDLSGRWMAANVHSQSSAGDLPTRTHTRGYSLEVGYEWDLGGLSLIPQAQYTWTEVQDVRTLTGPQGTFQPHGGTFARGRLGLELSKSFTSGNGLQWTPYGAIHAVREFDGKTTYTAATYFNGSTSLKGTSAMAELGLGVGKDSWAFTLGANWTDGGALKRTFGGQAVLRLAW